MGDSNTGGNSPERAHHAVGGLLPGVDQHHFGRPGPVEQCSQPAGGQLLGSGHDDHGGLAIRVGSGGHAGQRLPSGPLPFWPGHQRDLVASGGPRRPGRFDDLGLGHAGSAVTSISPSSVFSASSVGAP